MQFVDALKSSPRPLLVSAPLAAITHRGWRAFLDGFGGVDYHVNEMISTDALNGNTPYEAWYTDTLPDPSRTVIQLVGPNMDSLVRGVEKIRDIPSAGIDLNMGCSAPAILRKGAGAQWQEKPEAAKYLIKAVRGAMHAHQGLSVKLRLGTEDLERFADFCHALVEGGVQAILFHPRLRDDPWARPARQRLFPWLTRILPVPVVINGDIGSGDDIRRILALHRDEGAPPPAGIMIGRAAVSRPWIFAQEASKGQCPPVDRLAMARTFHELLERHQPQDFWKSRAKKFHQFAWKDLAFGSRLSARIQSTEVYGQIMPLVEEYFDQQSGERWISLS